jgi:TPR repeat protein
MFHSIFRRFSMCREAGQARLFHGCAVPTETGVRKLKPESRFQPVLCGGVNLSRSYSFAQLRPPPMMPTTPAPPEESALVMRPSPGFQFRQICCHPFVTFVTHSSHDNRAQFLSIISNNMKTHWLIRLTFASSLALVCLQTPSARGAGEFNLTVATAAADKGDAKAAYSLARHYAKGDGVPQDYAKAAESMRRAADLGHAYAQNDLGVYYAKGLGVKQDYQEAAKWYRKAAENGDSLGQFSLGRAYAEGRGVATNMTESIKWFKQAADQNQPEAMLVLGDIYMNGRPGIPIDYRASRKWLKKTVAQGRVAALNSLGVIYEQGGFGVDKAPQRALKCFREAAEKGDDQGQMNLGRMYRDGTGVKSEVVEAYQWFYLAAQNGNGIAKHYLMELDGTSPLVGGSLISGPQVDDAIRRAKEFQKSMGKKPVQ